MALRKKNNMRISLPPSLVRLTTHSAVSSPGSNAPHTPLPYDYSNSAEVSPSVYRHFGMDFDEPILAVGSKRGREEEEEVAMEWTEVEEALLLSVLTRPFRPLSTSFPPGTLPPPVALDELTNQVLAHPFRASGSPIRPSSSPTSGETEKWPHGWSATRLKLVEIALRESKGGIEAAERARMTRAEKLARPGLKRKDSMDFLDEPEAVIERGEDKPGRVIILSTTLQNTSKQDPFTFALNRAHPAPGPLDFESPSSLAPLPVDTPAPATPPTVAMITLTPASPAPPPPPAGVPMLRRKSSQRAAPKMARSRSLLQRGRSFTASDLQEEAARAAAQSASPPSVEAKPAPSPIPESPVPSPRRPLTEPITIVRSAPRITRSQSSTMISDRPALGLTKQFLAPQQISSDPSTLCMPLPIGVRDEEQSKKSNGWSDSEDDMPAKPRHIKKKKGLSGARLVKKMVDEDAAGLRSPFEEKSDFHF
ncbi:hypothetical protein P7C73_g875, partial [Tremellales sp. Uapishka_1]